MSWKSVGGPLVAVMVGVAAVLGWQALGAGDPNNALKNKSIKAVTVCHTTELRDEDLAATGGTAPAGTTVYVVVPKEDDQLATEAYDTPSFLMVAGTRNWINRDDLDMLDPLDNGCAPEPPPARQGTVLQICRDTVVEDGRGNIGDPLRKGTLVAVVDGYGRWRSIGNDDWVLANALSKDASSSECALGIG